MRKAAKKYDPDKPRASKRQAQYAAPLSRLQNSGFEVWRGTMTRNKTHLVSVITANIFAPGWAYQAYFKALCIAERILNGVSVSPPTPYVILDYGVDYVFGRANGTNIGDTLRPIYAPGAAKKLFEDCLTHEELDAQCRKSNGINDLG